MTRIEIPNSRRGSSGRGLRIVILVLLLLIAGVALWTWLTLSWAYSDGERAGILQKFSRKGWVCKTQEGEIAMYYGGAQFMGPGASPQMWQFSVRDRSVAAQLDKAVGHRVQLHYTEHPGVPTSCFAETRYFVDRVTVTDVQASPAASSGTPPMPDAQAGTMLAPPPAASTP